MDNKKNIEGINSDAFAKSLEEAIKEDLQQMRESLKAIGPEAPKFLISNEELQKISMPNLNEVDGNFLIDNVKLEEIYLTSFEEHKKVTDALISAGIDIEGFFFGTPSVDEIKKAYEALETAGIDPQKYFSSYPHLADFDLEEEPKGKSI